MWSTPEAESVAVSVTLTGEAVYQPAEQAAPLQLTAVVGAVRSIVHECTSGALVFPAASVAVMVNVFAPSVRPVYVVGDVHGDVSPANVQVNVAGSFAENTNVAVVELV